MSSFVVHLRLYLYYLSTLKESSRLDGWNSLIFFPKCPDMQNLRNERGSTLFFTEREATKHSFILPP